MVSVFRPEVLEYKANVFQELSALGHLINES